MKKSIVRKKVSMIRINTKRDTILSREKTCNGTIETSVEY